MGQHPDLEREQRHLDRAYDRIEQMRAAALAMRDSVLDQGRGGTHQAREERDVMVRASLARLERLEIGNESLCFGRIDCDTGERFYIGRIAVSDEDQEPLVVDWRAPVAEPFYRATGRNRMGLTRRRHFVTEGRRLLGIEDEILDLDGVDDGELALVGEGALLAALERSRTGQMRDIVATIQGEQDEIIRSPLHGVLVVQGGPGTGKTAVALHRAAYLLYTHRFPLERQGVLVVGPNPLFMRYIELVLPSLGETGVVLTTINGLVPVAPTGVDEPAIARLKGDARMARLLGRAVRDRQRAVPRDCPVPFGAYSLVVTPALAAEVVGAVKRRPGTHNNRRRQVEALLTRRLHEQYRALVERAHRTRVRAEVGDELSLDEFGRSLRRTHEFVAALDRMWPLLTPEELLHDLFGAPSLLALAAGSVLPRGEEQALHRKRAASYEDVAWTPDDLPLLDELAVLLGPVKQYASDDEHMRAYGHVVVDEAQDLSPMQLRMLARRSLGGSMTVVGDIAQATGHWTPTSWEPVLAHLPARRPPRIVELTVNYRTPSEVMDLAARVLAAASPQLVPPRSVRSSGVAPLFERAGADTLADTVRRVAMAEISAPHTGSVAVICPPSLVDAIDRAVTSGEPGTARESLDAPVTIVPVGVVKGLEFDSVIVVEPSRIVTDSPQGLHALYVALTRPTKRLAIVHAEPLPAPLADVAAQASLEPSGA